MNHAASSPLGRRVIRNVVLVAGGGFVGGALWYGLVFGVRRLPEFVPSPAMLISTGGAFLLGMFGELIFGGKPRDSAVRLFFTSGLCGGFTTAAGFAPEVVRLMTQGDYDRGMLYALGSIVLANVAWIGGASAARQWSTVRRTDQSRS